MLRIALIAAAAAVSLQAFDTAEAVEDAKKRADAMRFETNVTISPQIETEIEKAARSLEAMKPVIEEWKGAMHESNGTVVIDRRAAGKIAQGAKEPHGTSEIGGRIYLFMSSSVPKRTWREYARSIDEMNLGGSVVMVLRGCIGGCGKIRPTIRFISDILTDGGKRKDGMWVQIWIDPLLFRRYGITAVPTALYAKGLKLRDDTLGEGIGSNIEREPSVYRSEGDWGLDYHIGRLAEASGDPQLRKIAESMRKEEFYR